MLGTQVAYLEAMKRGRTLDDKDRAREIDQATHAKLNKLRSRPENAVCFDCDAIMPGWAVMPHGIFVCMDCAQLHRSLGPRLASNMACVSQSGLYRRPHNASVIVHFLKSPASMDYGAAVMRRLRRGAGLLPTDRECCTLRVWPNSAWSKRLTPSVCDGL